MFLVALSFAYFAKALSGSYMKSTITQLERRFDIPSYLIGVIDGSFEIGEYTWLPLLLFCCFVCSHRVMGSPPFSLPVNGMGRWMGHWGILAADKRFIRLPRRGIGGGHVCVRTCVCAWWLIVSSRDITALEFCPCPGQQDPRISMVSLYHSFNLSFPMAIYIGIYQF